MTNSNQEQKSWNNSTNTQIWTLIVNNWLNEQSVKDLFFTLFKDNFLLLKDEAFTEIQQRINDFSDNFILELQSRNIWSTEWIKDPWFQYSLFEAQKNYAKSWDKDIESVSIDLLVDRLNYNKRNLKQIVLDESIQVIPKLTNHQLDTLTIIFLLKNTQNRHVRNFDKLKWYLEIYIKPFISNLSKEDSLYQHIEYVWCWTISIWSRSIEDIFKNIYQWLFLYWYESEKFSELYPDLFIHKDLIIKCLNNNYYIQPNALNRDDWIEKIKNKWFTLNKENEFISLFDTFNNNLLQNNEIKDKLLELWWTEIEKLFDVWENSEIKSVNLTSVWIAIAQANFRRKTWITLDLDIWIKD